MTLVATPSRLSTLLTGSGEDLPEVGPSWMVTDEPAGSLGDVFNRTEILWIGTFAREPKS